MTGFDTANELRRRMGDRAAVWEFLRLFSAAWGLPGEPAAGFGEAAERLGPQLPEALREAYACGGLLDPRGAYAEDGVLAFHWADPLIAETAWGIPLAVADRPDPPVVIDTGSGWRPYLDRLSLACVDLALSAALDREDTLDNACELSPDQAPAVAARFDRVPLPELPMWVEVEESPVRWYSRPGQLLRTHGDDWMWVWIRAQTPADLARIHAAVPGSCWSR
ncbi:SMI1/KNR4 family protein [Catellatospora vulcania]|uniref:SMI1/KNR4 family protein n=1 Tax=Catellatospora vulcania TaxID=1460450 RepID=UPI0012D4107E|nr:SMI1/KNR4 family protein [Catellatospora vulcania]